MITNVEKAIQQNLDRLEESISAARVAEAGWIKKLSTLERREYEEASEKERQGWLDQQRTSAVEVHPTPYRFENLTVPFGTIQVVRDFSVYVKDCESSGYAEEQKIFVDDQLVAVRIIMWRGDYPIQMTAIYVWDEKKLVFSLIPGWKKVRDGVFFHSKTKAFFEMCE